MAATYKVLKIDELTRVSEIGGIEKYYRVQIKTKGGVITNVDVAAGDMTDDRVAPILEKQAVGMDKILAL